MGNESGLLYEIERAIDADDRVLLDTAVDAFVRDRGALDQDHVERVCQP